MACGVLVLVAAIAVKADRGALDSARAGWKWARQGDLTWYADPAVAALQAEFERETPAGSRVFVDVPITEAWIFQRLTEFAAIQGDTLVGSPAEAEFVVTMDTSGVDGSQIVVEPGQWRS